MDGGAWWAAVRRVAKSQTRLSDFTFTFHFHALEKETATHSSVLAWRVAGTGEPWWAAIYGVAQSHWSDLAAVAAAIYLLAQGVMNSSRMQEMWVWSLGQEGPWRREWLPRPVFLLGEFHRQRSLERYGPWDCKESDMTERLILLFFKLFTEQDMKTMI